MWRSRRYLASDCVRSGSTSSTSKQASAASAIGRGAGEIGWAGARALQVVLGGECALQVSGEDGGVDVEDVLARVGGAIGAGLIAVVPASGAPAR